MTRTISTLFLFLFLASCGKGGSGGGSSTMSEITESDLASEVAPVQAQTFEVNADLNGFESTQEQKIHQAFDMIKRVVATDEFKQKILGKKFKGKKQFNENNGLTNAQIYKAILEGSEMLTPGDNNSMDIALEPYYENANVIGYTKPSIRTIFLNTKYLNSSKFEINEVAMNLTHEWLHKLGFKHSVSKTATRKDTVPYAVGYIMRSLAAQMI